MNCGACGKTCLEDCRAGACQETKVVLSETFDTDAMAWQYDGNWERVVEDPHQTPLMKGVTGGLMACGPHDLLWKASFSLSGATEARLVFSYESQGSINDEYQVLASIDGGATWNVLGSVPRHAGDWGTGIIDVSKLVGQASVRLGFRLMKSCTDTLVQWWNLDSPEVRVMRPTP
jgi:hypothetical protein